MRMDTNDDGDNGLATSTKEQQKFTDGLQFSEVVEEALKEVSI